MCLEAHYRLCGIRLILEDFCPRDQAVLRPCGDCNCWTRELLCQGEVLFGSLPPGDYALSLHRAHGQMELLVKLPPGGNVEIRCRLDRGSCIWRRDEWHYPFNAQ